MKNSVEKRFEDLVRKWTKAINKPKVKIVRFHADHDEKNFIDDLFKYMLSIDTNQEDLVFLLETPWSLPATFSEDLLVELYETIEVWNTANRPDSIPNLKINWKPNNQLKENRNEAALFVKNINKLANELVPDKNIKVSFLLKIPFVVSSVNLWLSKAIDCGLEEHVRIGIADKVSNTIYSKLQRKYTSEVYTVIPNLDIDSCLEEIASLGNPQDADTKYRQYLVKLMNAVTDKNDTSVEQYGKKCLDISSKNVKENVNWISQIIFVYSLLCNHEMSKRNYDNSLFFADKAVEAGTLGIGNVQDGTAYRLYGQTLLVRGLVYQLKKNADNAAADYGLAIECFKLCDDYIMQCESTRLYAIESEKSGGVKLEILRKLIEAFYLVDKMSSEHIKNSTYPWLLKILYNWNGREKELPESVMKDKLSPHFGIYYMDTINQYGSSSYMKETAKKEPLYYGKIK